MSDVSWPRVARITGGVTVAVLAGAAILEYRFQRLTSDLARSREELAASRQSLGDLQGRAREAEAELNLLRQRFAATEEGLRAREEALARRMNGEVHAVEAHLRGDLRAVSLEATGRVDALAGVEQRLITRVEGMQQNLDRMTASERRRDERLDRVGRIVDPDKDLLHASILHTSAQVSGKGGVGGGVILYSRPDGDRGALTYVLTAYHVVNRSITTKEEKEIREPVPIRLYDDAATAMEDHSAEILTYDEKQDVALLRLWLPAPTPHVAKLAPPAAIRAIRVFTPVYAVGCPLGHDPMPTLGQIASLQKEVNGARFWMMNAPTIFGNSGGGIFLADSLELVGISSMICTYDQFISMPVPHLGILVSLDRVYDWMDRQYLQYVYDPATTKELCDRSRRSARERDPDVTRVTWD